VATQRSVEYDGTPSGPRMPSASSVLQQPPSSDLPAYVEAADTPATHEAEKFAMEDRDCSLHNDEADLGA